MAKTKKTRAATAASSFKPLQALGFTQAQLARMFQVDTCTLSQWARQDRVGAQCVARVRYIPELKGRVAASSLRPDLDASALRRAEALAKDWDTNERDSDRARETPGMRKPYGNNGTSSSREPVRSRLPAARKKKVVEPVERKAARGARGTVANAVAAAPRKSRASASKASSDAPAPQTRSRSRAPRVRTPDAGNDASAPVVDVADVAPHQPELPGMPDTVTF